MHISAIQEGVAFVWNRKELLGAMTHAAYDAYWRDHGVSVVDHLQEYKDVPGWHVTGWPVTTILRGKVAVDGGELHLDPSYGRRISRKISSEIMNGPAR